MKLERIISWAAIVLVPVLLFLISPYWSSYFEDERLLEYSQLHTTRFGQIGISEDSWPDLEILYQDMPVSNGGIARVSIRNSGTIPIVSSDYESAIAVRFSDDSQVLGYRVEHSSPDGLEIQATPEESALLIEPLLLNPKDYFDLEVLVKGDFSIDSVEARISGVKEILEANIIRKEGLFIEYIAPDEEPGILAHTSIFELHPGLTIPLGLVLATLGFAAINVRVRPRRPNAGLYLNFIVGLLCYSVGGVLLGLSLPLLSSNRAISVIVGTTAMATVLIFGRFIARKVDRRSYDAGQNQDTPDIPQKSGHP